MEAKVMLWILMAACLWWSGSSGSTSHFTSFLQTKVYEDSAAYRLSGPNGYCAEVKNSNYTDGNPIILSPCNSASGPNQLWTFNENGTIISNGKCLTTDGYSQGSHIKIHDCNTTDKDAIIWEYIFDSRDLVNPTSGLVLTAIPGTVGTELTVEVNISSSLQTWRVGNNTEPTLSIIQWHANLCLELDANGKDLLITNCTATKAEQHWLLYSDGTIRPEKNEDGCISYDNLTDAKLMVLSCWLGPSSQRWLYNSDSHTILNARTGLVWDAKNVTEIIVNRPNGGATQWWDIREYLY